MAENEAFVDRNLRNATFRRVDLSGTVMRGVVLENVELDSPWLLEGENTLIVNGVDVLPFVEAELNKRFPGRAQRLAETPAELRAAWSAVQSAWDATITRAQALPDGGVDQQVGGEWSFTQTLRHLVMATDIWLRQAVLGVEKPLHPLAMPNHEYEEDGNDMSVFDDRTPSFDEVLAVRSERVGMVTDYLAGVTEDELKVERKNPWAPQYPETTLSCIRTILEEEWEHLRYATRDLDTLEAGSSRGSEAH